uniref:Uncharacterized protein n=1 Tax=Ditylenchus dipsaci TaxID=166011 RepID=A0A915D513_9BILA
MEYLSATAYNFRMGQGPYELSEETYNEEDSSEFDMDQAPHDQNDVCAEEFGMKLTREDLDCLKPGKCLKGEVINYYMQLIIRRSDMDINLPTVVYFFLGKFDYFS